MADAFGIETENEYDLAQISQAVELKRGRKELDTFVKNQLSGVEPDETFRWLFSRRWKSIYTTNYDNTIERSYELNSSPKQTPVTMSSTQDIVQIEPRFQVPVIHLHGVLFGNQVPRIVITEDDYLRFRERRRMLFERLKLEFATATILYVGYSHRDPNWKLVLSELTDEFLPSPLPPSYRVTPTSTKLQSDNLKAKGIETIACDLVEFVQRAEASLAINAVDEDFLNRAQRSVPSELVGLFQANPPATSRLLNSWEYVNQAPFSARPNIKEFLRGDRPNWPLIAAREFFSRDIEDDLYFDMIDFATSSSTKPTLEVVLGPAGFGVTTLLLSTAVRLVQERAGIVLILKPNAKILEGDVEFALSIGPQQRVFFFVDDAGDRRFELEAAMSRLKQSRRAAMFVVGSRLNEWRQASGSLVPAVAITCEWSFQFL